MGTKKNSPDFRSVVLQAMTAAGLKPKPLSVAAGCNEHAVGKIISGDTPNPGITTLDKIARALDFESYVHMASTRPKLDEAVLRDAVGLSIAFSKAGKTAWPPEWIARAAVIIYRAHTDPSREAPPSEVELAMEIIREFGLTPEMEPAPQKPAPPKPA